MEDYNYEFLIYFNKNGVWDYQWVCEQIDKESKRALFVRCGKTPQSALNRILEELGL